MKDKIPLLLRCGPMQLLTLALFGGGGIFGMLYQHGRVMADYGIYELTTPFIDCVVLALLACLLLLISYFVRPLGFHFESKPRIPGLAKVVAAGYVAIGLALMDYNWSRIGAWEIAFLPHNGVAYRLANEKGLVFFYSTMVCFFIGSAYLLDHCRTRLARFAIGVAIVVFALGLLGLTRREMLLLMFLWGAVYVGAGERRTHSKLFYAMVVFGVIAAGVALYVNLLFRGIDFVEDPGSYFVSGEFEPFRYALYLIEQWLRDPILQSPLPYAIPFVGGEGPVTSVNIYFNEWIAGVSAWQGFSTVTIFPPMLYFGLLVPLAFYWVTVFLVKQSAYWLRNQVGFFSSFLYAFFLLKLFIMIRNGEMFASLVDSIVLLLLIGIFHSVIGFRCILDPKARASTARSAPSLG